MELIKQAAFAAIKGRDKLIDLIMDNGRFVYAYKHSSGTQLSGYNVLRHWGAIWSILTVSRLLKSPMTDEQIHKVYRSIEWVLEKHSKSHVISGCKTYAIVEKNKIKLGGQGLALLALSEFLAACNNGTYLILGNKVNMQIAEVTEGLSSFIFQMMLEEKQGVYKWKHKLDANSYLVIGTESDYYIGEALFGMASWSITRNKIGVTWSNSNEVEKTKIENLITDLAIHNYGVEFQSHWMLYAVSFVLENMNFTKRESIELYQSALIQHIQIHQEYRKKGSTAIACRTEAVLAAVPYLLEKEKKATLSRVQSVVHFNIPAQLAFCQKDGAVVKDKKDDTVQIDYIQHCISGLAQYAIYAVKLNEETLTTEPTEPTKSSLNKEDLIKLLSKSPELRKAAKLYLKERSNGN